MYFRQIKQGVVGLGLFQRLPLLPSVATISYKLPTALIVEPNEKLLRRGMKWKHTRLSIKTNRL